METVAQIKVTGVKPFAKDYPVWIVRINEKTRTEAEFFSAYDTEEEAREVVQDIHRAVIVFNPVSAEI